MVALLRPIRRRRPKHSAMATTRRLPSSAASPDPSCTTTPSWRLPGSWAMGSGSERASSRSFRSQLSVRGQVRRPGKGNDKGKVEGLVGFDQGQVTSWSPSRVPRASRPSTMLVGPNSAAGDQAARLRGHKETIGERLERDRQVLLPDCRTAPYDACDKRHWHGRVRCRWCVTAATTIPCPWPTATVRCSSAGYVDEVVISCGAEVIARALAGPTTART